MKTAFRLLLLSFIALGLTRGRIQAATGYKALVEVSFDEQGQVEGTKIVESDDPTPEQRLNQIALRLAGKVSQPPRKDKEGKPVKFKARAPFSFPVDGDEGPEADNAPKPVLREVVQPTYPEALAAAGTVGGAILELNIGADGAVKTLAVLRSSHPEFANAAYTAVRQWKFAPAQQNGAAGDSRWRIAVSFSLEGKEADWMWWVAPRPSLGAHAVRGGAPVPPAGAK